MTHTIFTEIETATTPQELFGPDEKEARKKFLSYSRRTHPDMVSASQKDQANRAFVKLTLFWEKYTTQNPQSTPQSNRIVSKRREYELDVKLYQTPLKTAYKAFYDDKHKMGELHIANTPQDNDLIANAVSALNKLKKVPDNYSSFFPKMIDKFKVRQATGEHSVLACEHTEGFVSLEEVRKAYPKGLHGRDLGWLFKRVLVAVGNTRDVGLVHGAFTPDNVFVHPEKHGLVLNNWEYSVEPGQSLVAVPPAYKDYYPGNVLKKEGVSVGLDLTLAVRTMMSLIGEDTGPVQTRFRAFFKGCLGSEKSVPHPSVLLGEFDEFLRTLYGEPRYHTFTMPR